MKELLTKKPNSSRAQLMMDPHLLSQKKIAPYFFVSMIDLISIDVDVLWVLMAAQHVIVNKEKQITRDAVQAVQMLRQAIALLDQTRGSMIFAIDGVTTDAVNFDLLATLMGHQPGDYADANTAAKKTFDEFDSLWGQVDSNVRNALAQFCALHAI